MNLKGFFGVSNGNGRLRRTVGVGVSSSRQSPDLACLWFEAGQRCPLVAKAVCAVVFWARGVRVTMLVAVACREGVSEDKYLAKRCVNKYLANVQWIELNTKERYGCTKSAFVKYPVK